MKRIIFILCTLVLLLSACSAGKEYKPDQCVGVLDCRVKPDSFEITTPDGCVVSVNFEAVCTQVLADENADVDSSSMCATVLAGWHGVGPEGGSSNPDVTIDLVNFNLVMMPNGYEVQISASKLADALDMYSSGYCNDDQSGASNAPLPSDICDNPNILCTWDEQSGWLGVGRERQQCIPLIDVTQAYLSTHPGVDLAASGAQIAALQAELGGKIEEKNYFVSYPNRSDFKPDNIREFIEQLQAGYVGCRPENF